MGSMIGTSIIHPIQENCYNNTRLSCWKQHSYYNPQCIAFCEWRWSSWMAGSPLPINRTGCTVGNRVVDLWMAEKTEGSGPAKLLLSSSCWWCFGAPLFGLLWLGGRKVCLSMWPLWLTVGVHMIETWSHGLPNITSGLQQLSNFVGSMHRVSTPFASTHMHYVGGQRLTFTASEQSHLRQYLLAMKKALQERF